MPLKKTTCIAMLVLLGVGLSINAHAQEIASAGVLDTVLQRYQDAASRWVTVIQGAATRLFFLLAGISVAWTFSLQLLRRVDIQETASELIRFTVFTGFFLWLLVNGPNFAMRIIDSMRMLAGEASGLGPGLSPSSIADIGFAIFFKTLDQSSFFEPVYSFAGIVLSLGILVILALVATNMLILLVSAWILAFAGIFFLGFGGSRWTSDMAINYYKTILGIGTQLFAMILIIGIGQGFLDDYYSRMAANTSLKEMGVLLIVVVILFLIAEKIPSLISGIITGANIGGAGVGAFGAGAAVGALGFAGAAAAVGGSLLRSGGESIVGGAQAAFAAFNKAQDNVANGTDVVAGLLGAPQGSGSSFADAAGMSGRLLADTAANLVGAAGQVLGESMSSMRESMDDRVSQTFGARMAQAMGGNDGGSSDQSPPASGSDGSSSSTGSTSSATQAAAEPGPGAASTFGDNSISAGAQSPPSEEVSDFINRPRE
jgi:type IV secretion system protein VirB6/type IV secretion system protein TrbL